MIRPLRQAWRSCAKSVKMGPRIAATQASGPLNQFDLAWRHLPPQGRLPCVALSGRVFVGCPHEMAHPTMHRLSTKTKSDPNPAKERHATFSYRKCRSSVGFGRQNCQTTWGPTDRVRGGLGSPREASDPNSSLFRHKMGRQDGRRSTGRQEGAILDEPSRRPCIGPLFFVFLRERGPQTSSLRGPPETDALWAQWNGLLRAILRLFGLPLDDLVSPET